jgi:hypothetical protein
MSGFNEFYGVDFSGVLKVRVIERTFFDDAWNITRSGEQGTVGLLRVMAFVPEDQVPDSENEAREQDQESALVLFHPTSGAVLMGDLPNPVFMGICAGGGLLFREGKPDGRFWAAYPVEATGLVIS